MKEKTEIWKDIQGYEGLYQVSSFGRIRSLQIGNRKGRIRIARAARNGYLYIVLSKKGKAHTIRVHKEVAKAFIPNPMNLNSVNHKNFDKTDNSIYNLEWMSLADNIHHAKINGKNNRKPIYQCDLNGNIIKEWESAYSVELEKGYFSTDISRVCRGLNKKHKGYKWRFKL